MQSKPISAARLAANHANGLKSTGPRTAAGKARVSQNALKRGLCSERNPLDLASDAALPIERDEFLRILAAYVNELAPITPLETSLVERLAQIELRLHRSLRLETAHLNQHAVAVLEKQGARDMSTLSEQQFRAHDSNLLMESYVRGSYTLDRIGRYESRLSREFARTLKQLNEAQERRATHQDANQAVQHPRPQFDHLSDDPRETPEDATETVAVTTHQKMTEQSHQVQENKDIENKNKANHGPKNHVSAKKNKATRRSKESKGSAIPLAA